MWVARALVPGEAVAIEQALIVIEDRLVPISQPRLFEQLARLAIHFQQKRSDTELESLFTDFAEDLAEYSEPHVLEALRDWRRSKNFFPKVAELVETLDGKKHYEERLRHRARVLLGLEAPKFWEAAPPPDPPPVSADSRDKLTRVIEGISGPLGRALRSFLEKASDPEPTRRRA